MEKNLIWKIGSIIILVIAAVLTLYPPAKTLRPGLDLIEKAGGLHGNSCIVKVLYDLSRRLHLGAFIHGIERPLTSALNPYCHGIQACVGHALTQILCKSFFNTQIGIPGKLFFRSNNRFAEGFQIVRIDHIGAEMKMLAAMHV